MAKNSTPKQSKAKKPKASKLPSSKTLFDHINAIKTGKDPSYWSTLDESDKKTWNTYMVNRFLSMNQKLIEPISELQMYTHLEPKDVYKLYASLFPRDPKFYRYIKANKAEKYDKQDIQMLIDHFEVSEREVLDYLEILDTPEGKEILRALREEYGNRYVV